jgi:uncharacterized membrane protein
MEMAMADLIATGYPDVGTAQQAMDEVDRFSGEPISQPGAVGTVVRYLDVKFRVTTTPLSRFGGTVLKSSLSKQAEQDLQDALHGQTA